MLSSKDQPCTSKSKGLQAEGYEKSHFSKLNFYCRIGTTKKIQISSWLWIKFKSREITWLEWESNQKSANNCSISFSFFIKQQEKGLLNCDLKREKTVPSLCETFKQISKQLKTALTTLFWSGRDCDKVNSTSHASECKKQRQSWRNFPSPWPAFYLLNYPTTSHYHNIVTLRNGIY